MFMRMFKKIVLFGENRRDKYLVNSFLKGRKTICKVLIFIIRPVCLGMLVMFFGMAPCGQAVLAALPVAPDLGSLLGLDLRVFVAGKPIYLVLVEKDKQRLRILEHDGRLRVVAEYRTATGENAGPKEREGDAKTPEGIYFITKIYTDNKITVFGKRAFHLDYPNIFDRQEGKGGTGIFVHGTNKELISNSTNGCITLGNNDLENIVEYLPLGTVPVVVVSSLSEIPPGLTSDVAVKEFVGNNFQKAREALGPADTDLEQIVFESLYMISTNSQIVAVGEYQRDGKKIGELQEELVRGYFEYDPASGWAVLDSVRKASGGKDALVHSRSVSHSNEKARAEGAIIQAPMPKGSMWADPNNQYLTWYLEALADSGDLKKRESQVVQKSERRPRRSQPDFAILFFLSVVASLGSAWLLMVIRAKRDVQQDESKADSDREENMAAIARMKKDINWTNNMLANLKTLIAADDQSSEELVGATAQIVLMTEELASLRERLQAAEGNAIKLSEVEKELTEMREKIEALLQEKEEIQAKAEKAQSERDELSGLPARVAKMAAEIKVASEERHRLGEEIRKVTEMEKELNEKNKKIEALLQEKEEIQAKAEKAQSERDELSGLPARVAEMAAEIKVASEERHRLGEELKKRAETEKELNEKNVEIEALLQEKQEIHERAEKALSERDELSGLPAQLAEMTEELTVAMEDRHRLGEELKKIAEIEKALSARNGEIETLLDENQTMHELLQEATKDKDELFVLRNRLGPLEENLKDVAKERDLLAEQLERIPVLERELSEKMDEIEELRARHATSTALLEKDRIETIPELGFVAEVDSSTFIPEPEVSGPAAKYLPNDVLKQWLGK